MDSSTSADDSITVSMTSYGFVIGSLPGSSRSLSRSDLCRPLRVILILPEMDGSLTAEVLAGGGFEEESGCCLAAGLFVQSPSLSVCLAFLEDLRSVVERFSLAQVGLDPLSLEH